MKYLILGTTGLILWLGTMVAPLEAADRVGAGFPAVGKKTPPPKPDPIEKAIETAFALPKNITLRIDQQNAYNALKQRYEGQLRAAMEKSKAAQKDSDKHTAATEISRLRKEIAKEIQKILQMKDPNTPQKGVPHFKPLPKPLPVPPGKPHAKLH